MIPKFVTDLNLQQISTTKEELLLKEGDESTSLYIILQGCIRLSFVHHRKELTTQFFFENDAVTLVQSLLYGEKSHLSIHTVEKCELLVMERNDCKNWLQKNKVFRDWFFRVAIQIEVDNTKHLQRFMSYGNHHRIELIRHDHPDWITRIPRRILASYVGTTNSVIYVEKNSKIADEKVKE